MSSHNDHRSIYSTGAIKGQEISDPLAWLFGDKYTNFMSGRIPEISNGLLSGVMHPFDQIDKSINPVRQIPIVNAAGDGIAEKPGDAIGTAIAIMASGGSAAGGGAGGGAGAGAGGSSVAPAAGVGAAPAAGSAAPAAGASGGYGGLLSNVSKGMSIAQMGQGMLGGNSQPVQAQQPQQRQGPDMSGLLNAQTQQQQAMQADQQRRLQQQQMVMQGLLGGRNGVA